MGRNENTATSFSPYEEFPNLQATTPSEESIMMSAIFDIPFVTSVELNLASIEKTQLVEQPIVDLVADMPRVENQLTEKSIVNLTETPGVINEETEDKTQTSRPGTKRKIKEINLNDELAKLKEGYENLLKVARLQQKKIGELVKVAAEHHKIIAQQQEILKNWNPDYVVRAIESFQAKQEQSECQQMILQANMVKLDHLLKEVKNPKPIITENKSVEKSVAEYNRLFQTARAQIQQQRIPQITPTLPRPRNTDSSGA